MWRPLAVLAGATANPALEACVAIRHGHLRCGERPDPGGPNALSRLYFLRLHCSDQRAVGILMPSGPRTWTFSPVSVQAYGLQCRPQRIAAIKPLRRRSPRLVLISALPCRSAHTATSRLLRSNSARIATIKTLQASGASIATSKVRRRSECIAATTALESSSKCIATVAVRECRSICIAAITIAQSSNSNATMKVPEFNSGCIAVSEGPGVQQQVYRGYYGPEGQQRGHRCKTVQE